MSALHAKQSLWSICPLPTCFTVLRSAASRLLPQPGCPHWCCYDCCNHHASVGILPSGCDHPQSPAHLSAHITPVGQRVTLHDMHDMLCIATDAHSAVAAAIRASTSVYRRMPLSSCLKTTSCPLNTKEPPCCVSSASLGGHSWPPAMRIEGLRDRASWDRSTRPHWEATPRKHPSVPGVDREALMAEALSAHQAGADNAA